MNIWRGILYGVIVSLGILSSSIHSQDISIGTILFNGRNIHVNDTVLLKPRITVTLSIPDTSKAVSWNIQIIDAFTEAVVQQVGVTAINPVLSSASLLYDVPQDLTPGRSYFARVSALQNGSTFTKNSDLFVVKSGFQLIGFVNGPNPFNPNNTATSFEYVLSADADVSITVMSVNGQEVWSASYPSGTTGGAEGFNKVRWDGRNKWGDTVANGIYVGVVIAKSGTEQVVVKRKIGVLK